MPPREATCFYADSFYSLEQYEQQSLAAAFRITPPANPEEDTDNDIPPPLPTDDTTTANNPQQQHEVFLPAAAIPAADAVMEEEEGHAAPMDPLSIDPTSSVFDEQQQGGEEYFDERLTQRRRVGEVEHGQSTPPRNYMGGHAMVVSPDTTPNLTSVTTPSSPDTSGGSSSGDGGGIGVASVFPTAVTTFHNSNHSNNTASNSHYHHYNNTISTRSIRTIPRGNVPPPPILRFCPRSTTITDLKYFAERGCIVPLLAALDTPRLVALGARLLADYAKCATRRVAVASNTRILEFLMQTMQQRQTISNNIQAPNLQELQGREYAVECIRSLTATEESDSYLLKCRGMLDALAEMAGCPVPSVDELLDHNSHLALNPRQATMYSTRATKSRLHACIAIMNLSCGKTNKKVIASNRNVLAALVKVLALSFHNGNSQQHQIEVILKGVTCIKNLSNADVNDAVLLGCKDLVSKIGSAARSSCLFIVEMEEFERNNPHLQDQEARQRLKNCAQQACTNACLALMNLSISKANKYTVFKSPGIMESLMYVLDKGRGEARVKACSALSNLAIGYANKVPMLHYPGFVQCILHLIEEEEHNSNENDDAIRLAVRTKACSILWSFAAESKNQVPVVQRGDILPVLVKVAREDNQTEARFKCIAALTLLAESSVNAKPLLEAGSLAPLMSILSVSGPDPTCWTGQTPSWCVGFLMNLSQSHDAVPYLREAGVIELLAPLLTLEHYQSLKAAMACTFILAHPSTATSSYALHTPQTYDLLRQIEITIPKIISLLTNTLQGKGGAGYKYGVFTLRSSVGCIAALSAFPDFIKGYLCTPAVIAGLGRVVRCFCVDGGEDGSIVGGGRDDWNSATLAVQALHSLISYLIPNESCTLFFTQYNHQVGDNSRAMKAPSRSSQHRKRQQHEQSGVYCKTSIAADLEYELIYALKSYALVNNKNVLDADREFSKNIVMRLESVLGQDSTTASAPSHVEQENTAMCEDNNHLYHKRSNFPCVHHQSSINPFPTNNSIQGQHRNARSHLEMPSNHVQGSASATFILTDRSGRRYIVPYDFTGGRPFHDSRVWCYRRGRFCSHGETPDPNFVWTQDLQVAYEAVLRKGKIFTKYGSSGTSAQGTVQD